MKRAAALLATTLLTACGGGASDLNDGRWIGPVTPTTQGTTCQPTKGYAQIREANVMFTPNEGTWVLDGTLNADGSMTAEKTTQGVNKQPFETRLEAKRTGEAIDGTYKTPRCTFTVHLLRQK